MFGAPLPLWESIGRLRRSFLERDAEAGLRLCRIVRCDPGEGLRTIDRPEPQPSLTRGLTRGEGGSPPLPKQCRQIFASPQNISKYARCLSVHSPLRVRASDSNVPRSWGNLSDRMKRGRRADSVRFFFVVRATGRPTIIATPFTNRIQKWMLRLVCGRWPKSSKSLAMT
jgi:hypothetical protein